MIKYIGIALTLIGIALFILETIISRRNGIKETASELALIVGSGYASTHKEAERIERVDKVPGANTEIKIAPKKRTLSKEAKEILAMVEQERAQESTERPAQTQSIREDIERSPARGNNSIGTDILNRSEKGTTTDILDRPPKSHREKTGILNRKASRNSTDILAQKEKIKQTDGTDILKRDGLLGNKTDVLRRGAVSSADEEGGTDLLDRSKQKPHSEATDILGSRSVAVHQDSGTDILPRNPEVSGTDVLIRDAEQTTETGTGILERRY